MNTEQLQKLVSQTFQEHFGRTPLTSRLQDILHEAIELSRWTDLNNLQEESGDLLCSVLALLSESNLNVEDVVKKTLDKINRRKQQYQTLGRKIKVALFGGAFDPPTSGHLAVAQFVLNTSKEFDEVWISPCYAHLHGKNMAPAKHRLKMCKLAFQSDGRIKVFDYEIIHCLRGETYHFVNTLLNDLDYADKYSFSYIIGMDNANHFDKWVNYEQLERLIRFVVVSRSGEQQDSKVNWYLKYPHIYLKPETPLPHISSSSVRKLLPAYHEQQLGDFAYALNLLDKNVLKYIRDNYLYSGEN